MRYSVYNPCPPPEKEKEVAFKLKESSDGGVQLVAVDPATGEKFSGGNILTITCDGYLKRHVGINPDLGLQLGHHVGYRIRLLP
jgi:hypothetical protein